MGSRLQPKNFLVAWIVRRPGPGSLTSDANRLEASRPQNCWPRGGIKLRKNDRTICISLEASSRSAPDEFRIFPRPELAIWPSLWCLPYPGRCRPPRAASGVHLVCCNLSYIAALGPRPNFTTGVG